MLDSRAFVGPDANYCGSIGLPGQICVVRDENDPQSMTCNNLAMGKRWTRAGTDRHGTGMVSPAARLEKVATIPGAATT